MIFKLKNFEFLLQATTVKGSPSLLQIHKLIVFPVNLHSI